MPLTWLLRRDARGGYARGCMPLALCPWLQALVCYTHGGVPGQLVQWLFARGCRPLAVEPVTVCP
jgi:hypothetical protein